MDAKSRGIAAAAAVAGLLLCLSAGAKEVKIKSKEVPGAILDTLLVHYPKAKFLGFSMETENDLTLFEAEMKIDDRHVDALLDSAGTFHEIETEIQAAELPEAVRTALGASDYAQGKIRGAERHVVPGPKETVTYELDVELRGRRFEVVYDADGKLINSEKSDEKD